jgi:hypothetical protein
VPRTCCILLLDWGAWDVGLFTILASRLCEGAALERRTLKFEGTDVSGQTCRCVSELVCNFNFMTGAWEGECDSSK